MTLKILMNEINQLAQTNLIFFSLSLNHAALTTDIYDILFKTSGKCGLKEHKTSVYAWRGTNKPHWILPLRKLTIIIMIQIQNKHWGFRLYSSRSCMQNITNVVHSGLSVIPGNLLQPNFITNIHISQKSEVVANVQLQLSDVVSAGCHN